MLERSRSRSDTWEVPLSKTNNDDDDVRVVADGDKDPAAVALGRRGGLKGGRARAMALSGEQRSAIARKAAHARWRQTDSMRLADE